MRNKRFWIFLLIVFLILVPMFVIQHPEVDVVQKNASGYEFLHWFLSGSYNKAELHGFLYLAMELLLLLQILPKVNEQRLVRMSRAGYWRELWKAMGISAFAFCVVFCLIQFFMTLLYLGPETMLPSGFALITVLFFIRLFFFYMICNGVFAILYGIILKDQIAAPICVVLFMLLFYWVFEKMSWGNMADSSLQILNLKKDLGVYDEFYSESGLDVLQYGLTTIKHILFAGLLYIGSLTVFEKRDILNGKK